MNAPTMSANEIGINESTAGKATPQGLTVRRVNRKGREEARPSEMPALADDK